jgi:Zn-dependent peptidase ImmA (M78 family)
MKRREPIRGIGVKAARAVREAIGYAHPTELEIEVLAHMRGALVRNSPARGARANLIRLGDRGIIGISEGLSFEERRWAIAHELGHFEAHAGVSFLGLCSSKDLVPAYQASGREPEANAFAAELLLPEDLVAKKCDVAKVSWEPICAIAEEFAVSVTAAALRFVEHTDERVAVVCAKDGAVMWSSATKDFGARPRRGSRIGEWTEAHDFFAKGKVAQKPQTVSASAWIDDAGDDDDLVEHVFAIPRLNLAMSVLWWKS